MKIQSTIILLSMFIGAAHGALLIENDITKPGISGAAGAAIGNIAQSFTMPTEALSYAVDKIEISLQEPTNPLQIILLSEEFSGAVSTLSVLTPGYVATSGFGTDGWDFEGITLYGGSTYWFHVIKPQDEFALLFAVADANPYPGGFFYGPNGSGTYTAFPSGDIGFSIYGTAIPEPSATGYMVGVFALALAVGYRTRLR